MIYKNRKASLGVEKRHPMLGNVLFFIESYSRKHFSIVPVVTASERSRATSISYYAGKEKDRSGNLYRIDNVPVSVHEAYGGVLRGTDLRARIYTQSQISELTNAINDEFSYDMKRPTKKVAQCHKLKNGALHFHIQVHPETRERA